VLDAFRGIPVANPVQPRGSRSYEAPVGPALNSNLFKAVNDGTEIFIYTPNPRPSRANIQAGTRPRNEKYERRNAILIEELKNHIGGDPKVTKMVYSRLHHGLDDEVTMASTTRRGMVLFQYDPDFDGEGQGHRAWRLIYEHKQWTGVVINSILCRAREESGYALGRGGLISRTDMRRCFVFPCAFIIHGIIPSVLSLPSECLDSICEYVTLTYKPTLTSLALVSRRWYSITSKYRFHSISITVDEDQEKLEEEVRTWTAILEAASAFTLVRYLSIIPARPEITGLYDSEDHDYNEPADDLTRQDQYYNQAISFLFGQKPEYPRAEDWESVACLLGRLSNLQDLLWAWQTIFPFSLLNYSRSSIKNYPAAGFTTGPSTCPASINMRTTFTTLTHGIMLWLHRRAYPLFSFLYQGSMVTVTKSITRKP
jgi:hypothetical protein